MRGHIGPGWEGSSLAGIGTVVNVLAILAGGCAGLVLKGGLKARYQQAVIQAMGLCIIFTGCCRSGTGYSLGWTPGALWA